MHSEDGFQKEQWSDDNQIKGTERSEQPPPVKEADSSIEPKSEKLIEGEVKRWNKETRDWEEGFYIALDQQQLSVYKGDSKDGELMH